MKPVITESKDGRQFIDGLSVRCVNALRNDGAVDVYRSLHEQKSLIASAVLSGRLKPGKVLNFGKVSYLELKKWLGMAPDQKTLLFYPQKDWAQIYAAMDK